jgi:hypothetical protein
MSGGFNFQKAREAWGDKVVAPTHRVFQEWLNNPLTKALKQSHKNELEKLEARLAEAVWNYGELKRAQREKVAAWMMQRGYATNHGDTIEDLLHELEWQISEKLTSNHTAPFVTGKRSNKIDTRKSWTA